MYFKYLTSCKFPIRKFESPLKCACTFISIHMCIVIMNPHTMCYKIFMSISGLEPFYASRKFHSFAYAKSEVVKETVWWNFCVRCSIVQRFGPFFITIELINFEL